MSSESDSRQQRMQHILAAYLQDLEAGRNPDREKLLAHHPELADDLRSFLAENDKMRRLVDQQAATVGLEVSAVAPALGTKVRYFGDYELLEEIARGGMGVVYKARQVSLNRIVALKMILAGQLASPEDVQRFRAEAEAAANLDHPNIVPIYEVGEHEGQHFFSMKLVEGGSLAGKLARDEGRGVNKENQKKAARLLATVARAVHHAHQRGILHRDLKPANLLLDPQGEPHVTDFGLARRVEGSSGQTKSGDIVGTPSYMPPEQARGEKALSTAVDVYSLGAILYELLTGRPPFRSDTPMETLLQIIEMEPTSPSIVNRQAAIDRDLDTICLKCLEKDPTRRYSSAEMLAEDLERWLCGEPILARPISRPERLLKWTRRRPERALLYGLAILALTIGLGWTAWQGWLAVAQNIADGKKLAADRKKLEEDRQTDLDAKEKTRKEDLAAKEKKHKENLAIKAWQHEWERSQLRGNAQANLANARRTCQAGSLHVGMLYLAKGLRQAVLAQDKDLERELRLELGRHAPRMPRLVTMRWNGDLSFWPRYGISISGDGKRLVAAGSRWGFRVCDVDASLILDKFTEKGPEIGDVAISRDGALFVSGVKLCDASTGKLLRKLDGDGGNIQFAPNGARLLSITWPGKLPYAERAGLWDPATGRTVGKPFDKGANQPAAFSPDSSLIAFVRNQGENERADVRLWDAVLGEARAPILPAAGVEALAFRPDSNVLATSGLENNQKTSMVRFWDVKTGKPSREPLPPSRRISALLFSPDGKLLLTAGTGGFLQLWDLDTGKPCWPEQRKLDGDQYHLSFSADGKTFWIATNTGLYQFETASGRLLVHIRHQCQGYPTGFAFSADGRRFAVAGQRQATVFLANEKGQRTGLSSSAANTILVWELPAEPGAKEDPRPLTGTPEQITLWVQVQTGRELSDEDHGGVLATEDWRITDMSINDWWQCREKLRIQ